MKKFATLLAVLALVGMASAENYASLGYSEDTVIEGDQSDQCTGTLVYNHDYSFENGYCWQMQGTSPPYYGAFAEGFDLGYVQVECGAFWLSQVGYYYGQTCDAYVWAGGVSAAPSGVLCVIPAASLQNIGYWPTCTLNEVPIHCCPEGEFAVGYWADFSVDICAWYCCSDENGFGGFPWTNVAPGIGYPTGWQHPSVVWGAGQSMGLGATITDPPSPAESQTWGSIKALFE